MHDCVGLEGQCSHIIGELVTFGADLNARTERGKTALHIATQNDRKETVCQLIKLGASLDATGKHGKNKMLRFSTEKNFFEVSAKLIAQGADAHISHRDGETALHCAAKAGYSDHVQELVKAGAGAEARDTHGNTPLLLAAENGHTQTVNALADVDAAMDVGNRYGETALHLAAKKGHTRTACALADAGVAVDVRNRYGETAVHLAAKIGHTNTVVQLVAHGAPFDSFDQMGCTPLFCAIQGGFTETANELRKAGATLQAKDKDGNTSLHHAVKSNHHELVKALIRAGANVHALNGQGESALLLAAKRDSTLAAKNLLDAGAFTDDEPDIDGNTPFSVALKRGNGELCCELARFGAPVDDTISFFPCLSNAVQVGDARLLARLVAIGASINERDEDGSSALHVALTSQRVGIPEWIIEHGGNVTLADASGVTPLHLAAKHSVSFQKRLRLVKLLLTKGADPTAMTNRSQTALDIANWHGDYNVVMVLAKAKLAHELVKAGGVVSSPDVVAIRFGGPPGAGKSTLTDALKVTRARGLFRYESRTDEGGTDMHQRTKGINCHNFVDEKSSRFTIFDLGGHGEFLATHQIFIGDGSVPVIDCVVVSALDQNPKENVLKWCSLFASRNKPNAAPWPLLLIATRADKATQQQKNVIISIYRDVEQKFREHFRFPCSEPFFIDARKSWNELTVGLRQVLSILHQELVDHDDSWRKPAICQCIEDNLSALRKTTSSPVIL